MWLDRACKGEDVIGCRLLGMMKVDGVGVAPDREEGTRLLKHACDKKDTEGCKALALVIGTGSGSANDARSGSATRDAGVPSTDAMKPRP